MARSTRLGAGAFLAAVIVSCWLPSSVGAQPSEGPDVAAAQRAFDEAMALMDQGRTAEACAKLEESQRIEAGMATQFRLAECYEKDGRVASAWKNFEQVALSARAEGLPDREAYAQNRANALLERVAKLTIQVPAEVASLPGLAVAVDGVVALPATWGGIPVDRGTRRLVAQADGKEPWTTEIEVAADGQRVTVRIPRLEKAKPKPAPPSPPPTVVRDPGPGPLTVSGLVVGGVGLAGMIVGVTLGVVAKGNYDESDPECQDDVCSEDGLAIRADARTLGDVGTGVFIAGAVLAAGGVVLWLADPTGGSEDDVIAGVGLRPTLGGGQLTAEVRW